MGNTCSSLEGISENEYLRRLCSTESICENDPFWNALLAFSLVDLDLVALSSSNSKLLDDTANSLCKNIAVNNPKTGNFHTLVVYFIRRLDGVISTGVADEVTNPFAWQVLNGLFITRIICKHFVQNLTEELIIQQFVCNGRTSESLGANVINEEDNKTISKFVHALFKGLLQVPIHETTVLLHLEIINTVITLLGMTLYQAESCANNMFYMELMEGEASALHRDIINYLLNVYAHHDQLPSYVYRTDQEEASLTSTLWSALTLGMGGSKSDVKKVNVGTQGLLLLLILTNHNNTTNPYRVYLSQFSEEQHSTGGLKLEVLYLSLCNDLRSNHAQLLLYSFLHQNQIIKAFILSRTDTEKITEPILRVLHDQSADTHPHHIYISLLNLLMLTEDDGFNSDLFKINMKSLTWYTDKKLADLSLGDVLILVVIKVMQYNMSHTKDRYLHTNCLATLANVSSKFSHLSTYTSQKLISFYCALVKRHHKILEKLQLSSMKGDAESETLTSQLASDLEAIEEMIRLYLEIFNSCLVHAIHLNTHLVHVMLCHKEEFDRFMEIESFKNILQNIHLVLEQFHLRLEREIGDNPRTEADVLEVISEGLKTFRRSQFTKLPDLKFKYIEERDSSKFFIPYVWNVVCQGSNLHFKQSPYVSNS